MPREVNAVRFGQPNDERGKPNSEKCTGGISGAMNAEGESALFFVNAICDESVARRGADSFSRVDPKIERREPLPKNRR